ncbi:MAG: hypothetical protein H7255_20305 [Ramlibacter sp.]|nr:hypothetical protein [Ramlibacter sp.]
MSDVGDNMGQGQTYEYTKTNADIHVSIDESLGYQYLAFEADGWDKWRGVILLPAAVRPLKLGRFDVVSDVSISPQTRVGIAPRNGAGGWDRSCPGATTGWVDIKSVTYASPGVLGSLSMDVELRCVGSTSAIRGIVEWKGYEAPAIPGPVSPIPASLWSPGPGTTPATGNYVYLESQPGDPVGGGVAHVFAGAELASMSVTEIGRRLSFSQFVPGEPRAGEFFAMASLTQLQAGYYPNMRGQPAVWGPNQLLGGMYWTGPGTCPPPPGPSGDQLAYETASMHEGWFAIDRIERASGAVQAVDVRFEQKCVGSSAMLRGKIHWVRP